MRVSIPLALILFATSGKASTHEEPACLGNGSAGLEVPVLNIGSAARFVVTGRPDAPFLLLADSRGNGPTVTRVGRSVQTVSRGRSGPNSRRRSPVEPKQPAQSRSTSKGAVSRYPSFAVD